MQLAESFSKTYAGSMLYSIGDGVRVRRTAPGRVLPDMRDDGIRWKRNRSQGVGTATGRQLQPIDGKGNGWMEVQWGLLYGWVRFDLVTRARPTRIIQIEDGETLIVNLVARDNRTAQEIAIANELLRK
jgi:hypothetical protein